MIELLHTSLGLLPVILFLAGLMVMDSFKLVSFKKIFLAIFIGGTVTIICWQLNGWLMNYFLISKLSFSRYFAPVTEETLKALYLIFLIRSSRVGFLVDSSINAFAIGTGFALVENIFYWFMLENSSTYLWVIRGFGTAALHGGTLIIFANISKTLHDKKLNNAKGKNSFGTFALYLPGLLFAIVVHSMFNHFMIPPIYTTLATLIILALMVLIIFNQSEKATTNWLGTGLDVDMDLIESISTGDISDSKIGKYLNTLIDKFPPVVVADMLCLLRLHAELSVAAKGILLAQEVGVKLEPDPEIMAKLNEMKYLEKSIGVTGLLTLHPFLGSNPQHKWQRSFLESQAA